ERRTPAKCWALETGGARLNTDTGELPWESSRGSCSGWLRGCSPRSSCPAETPVGSSSRSSSASRERCSVGSSEPNSASAAFRVSTSEASRSRSAAQCCSCSSTGCRNGEDQYELKRGLHLGRTPANATASVFHQRHTGRVLRSSRNPRG